MAPNIEELKAQIQTLRGRLKDLTANRELTDPEVVGASQILDALLLEYEKVLMKKNAEVSGVSRQKE